MNFPPACGQSAQSKATTPLARLWFSPLRVFELLRRSGFMDFISTDWQAIETNVSIILEWKKPRFLASRASSSYRQRNVSFPLSVSFLPHLYFTFVLDQVIFRKFCSAFPIFSLLVCVVPLLFAIVIANAIAILFLVIQSSVWLETNKIEILPSLDSWRDLESSTNWHVEIRVFQLNCWRQEGGFVFAFEDLRLRLVQTALQIGVRRTLLHISELDSPICIAWWSAIARSWFNEAEQLFIWCIRMRALEHVEVARTRMGMGTLVGLGVLWSSFIVG